MQKLQRDSPSKKRSSSGKNVASAAPRMLRESHVSHAFEQPEEPPTGHFSEPQVGGRSFGVQVSSQHASPGGTPLWCLQLKVRPWSRTIRSRLLVGGNVAVNVQQTDGEVATRPAKGDPSSSDVNRDIQVPTSSSGLFLRRGGDVIILSVGSFLNGLEEFEKAFSDRADERNGRGPCKGMLITILLSRSSGLESTCKMH